jgi:hypothetical protein
MKRALAIIVLLAAAGPLRAAPAAEPHRTDWLHQAQWGIFTHYLTGPKTTAEAWNRQIDAFDVPGLAKQLEATGCRYYVITLGQNSGHYCAPNEAYDRIAGIQPGKYAKRDLVSDIHAALAPKGIRLMLYLPCQVPNADPVAQKAFGLPQGARDQPLDEAFARKWAEVIACWSTRYGKKISGWWFDGGYKRAKLLDVTGTKPLDVNSGKHFARLGVDGDPATRAHAGGEWPWTYHVDLGAAKPVARVVITFDPGHFATEYKVNLSADGQAWTTAAHVTGCNGGKREHAFAATPARYVRIQALKPDGPDQEGKQMGVAELEVYGPGAK